MEIGLKTMEGAAGRTMTTVCVTGAGGFVASWLVERLLATGRYTVHGTVRDPGDAKNAHLPALGGAAERLRLFRADVLDYGSVAAAIAGCDGVFHVACPTASKSSLHMMFLLLQVELLAPAVTGTMNVLKACSEAKVKRVVMVSSLSAVMINPEWGDSKAMDESCWSDIDVCRTTENWYCLSKTLAEVEAFDYAKRTGLDLVTICPSLVIGPLLQPTLNASSAVIVDFLKGFTTFCPLKSYLFHAHLVDLIEPLCGFCCLSTGDRLVKMKLRNFVDVRDVADALLLVYEAPDTSGRYICNSHPRKVSDVIKLLNSWYPTYQYATKFVQVSDEPSFSSKKLQAVGWKFRPFEETLRDSVESFQDAGLKKTQQGRRPGSWYRNTVPMEGAAGTTMATVCVTGAGGFVASWLVERLLAGGRYTVHGTVRDPDDPKNAHLAAMDGAAERLRLFKADILDYGSVAAAVAGCDGVYHVASPAELLAPAVTGTINVLKACSEAKVKRVVVVSSVSAVMVNPQSKVLDEDCWSDVEVCRTTQNWYCLSKTLAEQEAFAYAKRTGLDVVTVCPSLVIGPLLQSTVNASSSVIVDFLTGDNEVKLKLRNFVDVRDVADALLLVYETPEASGRYICHAHARQVSDVIGMLKSWYPAYKCATKLVQVSDEPLFSCKKLEALGWRFRPLEETLRDSVESFRDAGGPHATCGDTPRHAQPICVLCVLGIYPGQRERAYAGEDRAAMDGGAVGETKTETETVCVTGAGGFIASWLVQRLLSRGGYVVRGTVRDPSDPKNAHLMALDGARGRLRLCKADLLDYAAVAGCDGVFHVASPVPAANPPNPDVEVLAPAVAGTRHVLAASHAAGVRRVVVVSSVGAVIVNPKIRDGAVVEEDSWSDEDYCRTTENWYCLSKTVAEREALAYGEKAGLDVVTVCPPWVLGPLLQPTLNTTSMRLVAYLKGENTEEKMRNMVDVRDVADALVLVQYEAAEASGRRRYICSAHTMKLSEMVALVNRLHPDLKLMGYPRKFVQAEDEKGVSSERLQALGWKFRTAEETLRDTVASYRAAGILD
ncbi:hypothetical protein U9M48_026945 [Paspalum notatum var. saurae]|uniref:NAD-dependent epimerase/dehydratase domain-containing protein n=1 Tax=Paspalum notatum var. saurae TaxID=547442 RepID=A0AAQ3TTT3_PASNO